MSVSVGHKLRAARQEKNLTIEQVSRVTFIRPRHLEAIEAGNLDVLPSLTQAKGFVRTYANHVGLDPQPLVTALEYGSDFQPEAPQPAVKKTLTDEFVEDLFHEIAFELKNQRETLGLSLPEAENQTRVRQFYLEALEGGRFDNLPSPVQGRGMLKNYAEFLGLDADRLLLKFADGLQAQLAARRGAGPTIAGQTRRSLFRRMISGDLVLGSVLILGFIVVVIWGVGRVTALQSSQQPDATAPSIVDILDPSQTPTPTPITPTPTTTLEPGVGAGEQVGEAVETATPDLIVPLTNEDPVQVYIVILQRTWMRVSVDGSVQFDGRVIPGSAYPYSGRSNITVLTGSGSALEVFYNGESLGPLGLFGQIVERIYTPDGVRVPTPAVSPTPTPTETPETTETPVANSPVEG